MDVVKPDPGVEQTNPDPVVYRCRKCRRIVATRKNIMTHSVKIKTDTKGANKSKEKINSDQNLLIEKMPTENLECLPNIMKSCTLSSEKSLDQSSEIEICNKIYFVEPLSWMNVINNIQGCLKCPKCSSKLGNFNWIEGELNFVGIKKAYLIICFFQLVFVPVAPKFLQHFILCHLRWNIPM
jgi:dual specificity phosphatase 12